MYRDYKQDLDSRSGASIIMQVGDAGQQMFQGQSFRNIKQSHLQQICTLDVDSPIRTYRMTNIVCTVGPSCESVEVLKDMVASGMNICRFNMAHASHEWHLQTLRNLREAVDKSREVTHGSVATAIDITGPGVRLGRFSEDVEVPVQLQKGATVIMSSDKAIKKSCTKDRVYVIQGFIMRAKVGDKIFIDDGPLCFKVMKKVSLVEMIVEVVHQGEMNHNGLVHIPMTTPNIDEYLSEKDKKDIKFGVDNEVDMVFVSWVLQPEMVTAVREALGDAKDRVAVVAKIESYNSVKRIDEILEVADGILIARGDLGNDIPPEKVFLAQKMIIGRANMAGKPVICAAQICQEAENALYYDATFRDLRFATPVPTNVTHATSIAAVEAAIRGPASAIIVVTNSGRSARLIARYRPHCIIIAITKSQDTARNLNLHRGIFSVIHTGSSNQEWYRDVDQRIHYALRVAVERGYVKPNDKGALLHSAGNQSSPLQAHLCLLQQRYHTAHTEPLCHAISQPLQRYKEIQNGTVKQCLTLSKSFP
ncbi:pyruvate kinase [Elysia marginata]|uniref:Pyruvate kinase n=1 Tax=Elysia marginata TaxID=1093978 RepID=A0AAV4GEE7_9GAST|nr:pyruvate kinase [Elysia marginata]